MKKALKVTSFFTVALSVVLTSCSVEKRVHMSGYHIEWKKGNHTVASAPAEEDAKSKITAPEKESNVKAMEAASIENANINEDMVASVDNSVYITRTPKINLKNVNRSEANNTALIDQSTVVKQKTTVKKAVKKENKAAAGDGSKSKVLAAILAFFLGILGIHRFYLGYTGIGVIQLIMGIVGLALSPILIGLPILGLLWIWVVVDFIRILLGNLAPKNGSYK